MAITTVTLIDELQHELGDSDGTTFTDAQYEGYLLDHLVAVAADHRWTRKATGLYIGSGWLWGASFDEEDGCSYTLYEKGIIRVTTGTDSRSYITVNGATIDFSEAVVSACLTLITRNALQGPQSIGGGFFTPPNVDAIRRVMEYHRGVRVL